MFKNKKLVLAIKVLLTIAIFFVLFSYINPRELAAVFSRVSLPDIIYLLLISVMLVLLSAKKWGLILAELNPQQIFSLRKLSLFYLSGYFINSFLPSFVGGDAARSYLVSQRSEKKATGYHATIIERLSGLLAMLLLGSIIYWLTDFGIIYFFILLAGLAAVAVVILIFSYLNLFSLFKHPLLVRAATIQTNFQAAFRFICQRKKLLLQVLILSLLFHCFTVLNTAVAGAAVGWNDIPYLKLFVVLPMILIVSFIPLTPGGLGVQEGAFVFFLTQCGATAEEALALSLVLRFKHLLLAGIGGFYLAYLNLSKKRN